MTQKLIKIDKNGTKYWQDDCCPRCGGTGRLPEFERVNDGVCFLCGGSGIHESTWKEYTAEYRKILDDRRRARALKKSAEYNQKFLADKGFSEDGRTWLVMGNTYGIKDELKSAGARFNNLLLWHFDHDPDGYDTTEISVDDVCDRDYAERYSWKAYSDVVEFVSDLQDKYAAEHKPASTSDFVGEVGKRITVEIVESRTVSFKQHFGWKDTTMNIHIMKDASGNVFTWKSQNYLGWDEPRGNFLYWHEIERDEHFFITGTVKEHSVYQDEKQTVLTRCKIKKGGAR